MRVGLSAASAYAFRRTAKGAAFALGWRAASLLARDAIAETLLVRALEGQVTTIVRADGSIQTRHHHDNGLCMRLLARLDRQVETAPDADVKAARLVAQEFDAFLDLVARDEGPARAGLFLARRAPALTKDGTDPAYDLAPIYALAAADRFARTGVATAGEVDVSDLDPAARADWTADQWQRAEAAGLLALAAPAAEKAVSEPQLSQHSPAHAAEVPIWWSDDAGEYRTSFAPPDGFDGDENGAFGDADYDRALSDHEAAIIAEDDAAAAAAGPNGPAERDAYFGPAPAGGAREANEDDGGYGAQDECGDDEAAHCDPLDPDGYSVDANLAARVQDAVDRAQATDAGVATTTSIWKPIPAQGRQGRRGSGNRLNLPQALAKTGTHAALARSPDRAAVAAGDP